MPQIEVVSFNKVYNRPLYQVELDFDEFRELLGHYEEDVYGEFQNPRLYTDQRHPIARVLSLCGGLDVRSVDSGGLTFMDSRFRMRKALMGEKLSMLHLVLMGYQQFEAETFGRTEIWLGISDMFRAVEMAERKWLDSDYEQEMWG